MAKRLPLLLLLSLFVAVSAVAPAQTTGASSLVALNGEAVVEKELQGDVIALFFASWSPRCRDVVERTAAVQARWGERATVILVNFQEDLDQVRGFIGPERREFKVYVDREGTFSKKHGITFLPGLLVLNDGRVAFRGKLPADADSLLTQVFGE